MNKQSEHKNDTIYNFRYFINYNEDQTLMLVEEQTKATQKVIIKKNTMDFVVDDPLIQKRGNPIVVKTTVFWAVSLVWIENGSGHLITIGCQGKMP